MMTIRSRAPLRIGLAGGGTDLAEYSDKFGGCVFNATIGMYSYCTLKPTNNGKIVLKSGDNMFNLEFDSVAQLPVSEPLILHKGVYNRIVKEFNGGKPLSFEMTTSSDAPFGSGLGTSSTMVVAIVEAFDKLLSLGLTDYKKANLAYEIERIDLAQAGGRQDQYAAVFGGFNFMNFKQNGTSVVNQLRIPRERINELESSLLIYYTGKSRNSSTVINQQINNTKTKNVQTMEAMHKIKESAAEMKDAVLIGDFIAFAEILRSAWENKKKTSNIVTNSGLECIIEFAYLHGAEAVKVSGAGGGGFILMYCNPVNRQVLFNALKTLDGLVYPIKFSKNGVQSWFVEG